MQASTTANDTAAASASAPAPAAAAAAASSSAPSPHTTSFHPIHQWLYFVPGVLPYIDAHSTSATAFPGLLTVYYATQCTCSCQNTTPPAAANTPAPAANNNNNTNTTANATGVSHANDAPIESRSTSQPSSSPSAAPIPVDSSSVSVPPPPPGTPSTATLPTNPLSLESSNAPFWDAHPFLVHSASLPIRAYAHRSFRRRTEAITLHNLELVLFDPHARTAYVNDRKRDAIMAQSQSRHRPGEGADVEELDDSAIAMAARGGGRKKTQSIAIGSSIPFTFGPAPQNTAHTNDDPFLKSQLMRALLKDGEDPDLPLSTERIYEDYPHLIPQVGTPMQLLSLAPVSLKELKHLHRLSSDPASSFASASSPHSPDDAGGMRSLQRSNSIASNVSMATPFHHLKIDPSGVTTYPVQSTAAAGVVIPIVTPSLHRAMGQSIAAATAAQSAAIRTRADYAKQAVFQYIHLPANALHAEQQFYSLQDDGWYKILIQTYVDCRCHCGAPAQVGSTPSGSATPHHHLMRANIRFGAPESLADFAPNSLNSSSLLYKTARDLFQSRQAGTQLPHAPTLHPSSSGASVLSHTDTSLDSDAHGESQYARQRARQREVELETLQQPATWRSIRCPDDIRHDTNALLVKNVTLSSYKSLLAAGLETITQIANMNQGSSDCRGVLKFPLIQGCARNLLRAVSDHKLRFLSHPLIPHALVHHSDPSTILSRTPPYPCLRDAEGNDFKDSQWKSEIGTPFPTPEILNAINHGQRYLIAKSLDLATTMPNFDHMPVAATTPAAAAAVGGTATAAVCVSSPSNATAGGSCANSPLLSVASSPSIQLRPLVKTQCNAAASEPQQHRPLAPIPKHVRAESMVDRKQIMIPPNTPLMPATPTSPPHMNQSVSTAPPAPLDLLARMRHSGCFQSPSPHPSVPVSQSAAARVDAWSERIFKDAWNMFQQFRYESMQIPAIAPNQKESNINNTNDTITEYYVCKDEFLAKGGSILNGGHDYQLTPSEVFLLWNLIVLPKLDEPIITFSTFVRVHCWMGRVDSGEEDDEDVMRGDESEEEESDEAIIASITSPVDQSPPSAAFQTRVPKMIGLRPILLFFAVHFDWIRDYCLGSDLSLFATRLEAESDLVDFGRVGSSSRTPFVRLRFCEGRYDRYVQDQVEREIQFDQTVSEQMSRRDSYNMNPTEAQQHGGLTKRSKIKCRDLYTRRQPVHRQFIASMRRVLPSGEYATNNQFVHHTLFVLDNRPLHDASHHIRERPVLLLALNGHNVYRDFNMLQVEVDLKSLLRDRAVEDELVSRYNDLNFRAHHIEHARGQMQIPNSTMAVKVQPQQYYRYHGPSWTPEINVIPTLKLGKINQQQQQQQHQQQQHPYPVLAHGPMSQSHPSLHPHPHSHPSSQLGQVLAVPHVPSHPSPPPSYPPQLLANTTPQQRQAMHHQIQEQIVQLRKQQRLLYDQSQQQQQQQQQHANHSIGGARYASSPPSSDPHLLHGDTGLGSVSLPSIHPSSSRLTSASASGMSGYSARSGPTVAVLANHTHPHSGARANQNYYIGGTAHPLTTTPTPNNTNAGVSYTPQSHQQANNYGGATFQTNQPVTQTIPWQQQQHHAQTVDRTRMTHPNQNAQPYLSTAVQGDSSSLSSSVYGATGTFQSSSSVGYPSHSPPVPSVGLPNLPSHYDPGVGVAHSRYTAGESPSSRQTPPAAYANRAQEHNSLTRAQMQQINQTIQQQQHQLTHLQASHQQSHHPSHFSHDPYVSSVPPSSLPSLPSVGPLSSFQVGMHHGGPSGSISYRSPAHGEVGGGAGGVLSSRSDVDQRIRSAPSHAGWNTMQDEYQINHQHFIKTQHNNTNTNGTNTIQQHQQQQPHQRQLSTSSSTTQLHHPQVNPTPMPRSQSHAALPAATLHHALHRPGVVDRPELVYGSSVASNSTQSSAKSVSKSSKKASAAGAGAGVDPPVTAARALTHHQQAIPALSGPHTIKADQPNYALKADTKASSSVKKRKGAPRGAAPATNATPASHPHSAAQSTRTIAARPAQQHQLLTPGPAPRNLQPITQPANTSELHAHSHDVTRLRAGSMGGSTEVVTPQSHSAYAHSHSAHSSPSSSLPHTQQQPQSQQPHSSHAHPTRAAIDQAQFAQSMAIAQQLIDDTTNRGSQMLLAQQRAQMAHMQQHNHAGTNTPAQLQQPHAHTLSTGGHTQHLSSPGVGVGADVLYSDRPSVRGVDSSFSPGHRDPYGDVGVSGGLLPLDSPISLSGSAASRSRSDATPRAKRPHARPDQKDYTPNTHAILEAGGPMAVYAGDTHEHIHMDHSHLPPHLSYGRDPSSHLYPPHPSPSPAPSSAAGPPGPHSLSDSDRHVGSALRGPDALAPQLTPPSSMRRIAETNGIEESEHNHHHHDMHTMHRHHHHHHHHDMLTVSHAVGEDTRRLTSPRMELSGSSVGGAPGVDYASLDDTGRLHYDPPSTLDAAHTHHAALASHTAHHPHTHHLHRYPSQSHMPIGLAHTYAPPHAEDNTLDLPW